jgi:hypothetical protein
MPCSVMRCSLAGSLILGHVCVLRRHDIRMVASGVAVTATFSV